MAKELVLIDAHGDKQAVDLNLEMYKEAAERGQSLPQYLASKYPTDHEKYGAPFEQLLEQCGIFVKGNAEYGIRASNMEEVLTPKAADSGSAITRDGIPASRLLFPAVALSVIENKLQVDLTQNVKGLASMIAVEDSIAGDRWERPVLDFSNPEAARAKSVSQLSLPNAMLTITASDKSMRVPSWAIGMEISEQALRSTTLDLVGLAVARQASVESNERAQGYITSFLNGDADLAMAALSSINGKVVTATSLDASIASAAGKLTQLAWVKWLSTRWTKRTISHVVTDLSTAIAIENRSGKPGVTSDNPTSPRIDTVFDVVNPMWQTTVKIFLTDDPNWPANTIMGIDARFAIHKVNSLTAQYSAIENFALKRSTALRFDRGELLYRLFDEAFEVLTLT